MGTPLFNSRCKVQRLLPHVQQWKVLDYRIFLVYCLASDGLPTYWFLYSLVDIYD